MGLFSEDKLKKLEKEEAVSKKHTILLVDDEVDNLTILKGLLSKEYNILTASDGQEALELVFAEETPNRIHLIISDQRMPNLTGVEFLERTIPILPKTIRMVVTGFADIDAIIDAINKGQIYKFILKPFDRQDMLLTVKRAIESYELKDENILLNAINRKLNDMNQSREHLLKKMNDVYEHELKQIETILHSGAAKNIEECRLASKQVHQIQDVLRPIQSLYFSEKAVRNRRILLAESNKKNQLIAKMALGGTGVAMDIASHIEEGANFLAERKYDVIFVDSELIQLVPQAHEINPEIYSVFMTSEHAPAYLSVLRKYSMISNIVSRNEEDRTFTIKNVMTTITKLLNQDLFGLDKYLNWGVEIIQQSIESSEQRLHLIEDMEEHFRNLGVRANLLGKCAMTAEELLMNAIYDAPVDMEGKPLYNHLPRTVPVNLRASEFGTFRYACDGMLLGISVEDPFGAFDRATILDYLESCYSGKAGSLQKNKGGAGRGLFHIMETADLVVWNIKPKIRTEVIALFNIDPAAPRSNKTTSFHYFSN